MGIREREIKRQRIILNGKEYGYQDFIKRGKDHSRLFDIVSGNTFLEGIAVFLERWTNEEPTLTVNTSGSTGKPKPITIEKSRMVSSAVATLDFFALEKGNRALLCLPYEYIAGMMMIVRALTASMELIAIDPTSRPFASITSQNIDFVALTPMQVAKTLENNSDIEKFAKVKNIIIGGSSISRDLEGKLKPMAGNIFSTYGMTETLSHIALRRINTEGNSPWYKPLKGVSVSLSNDDRLIINAPNLCAETLYTNDIAEVNNAGEFRILGRIDNVINSGGIKIQIEEIEDALYNKLGFYSMLTYKEDNILGQRAVLLVDRLYKPQTTEIQKAIESIDKKKAPKEIIFIDTLPTTPTGKPDRARAQQIAVTN